MRHVLLSVVLLSATLLAAQNSKTTPTSAGSATTIQGCLSSSNGSYTLTEKNGTAYQLSGDTAKLSEHIGHEMRITGTTGSPSASASSGTSASHMGGSSHTLQVTSFKHISKTCQNSNGMSH